MMAAMKKQTSQEVAVHRGFVKSDQLAIVVITSTFRIAYRKLSKLDSPRPGLGLPHTERQKRQRRATRETEVRGRCQGSLGYNLTFPYPYAHTASSPNAVQVSLLEYTHTCMYSDSTCVSPHGIGAVLFMQRSCKAPAIS